MTKVTFHKFPVIDRDSFLTPFDRMFDDIVGKSFPEINRNKLELIHFKVQISKSKCI